MGEERTEQRADPARQQPHRSTTGLIGAGVIEAIGFGAALAVIALGRPVFVELTRTPGKAVVTQVATAWLLGSWWPHSALHMHFGLRADALVGLEVIFHAGSIMAFALLLWALAPTVTNRRTSPRSTLRSPVEQGNRP